MSYETRRTMMIDGEARLITQIDAERADFGKGDVVYAIWPAYQPESRFVCIEYSNLASTFRAVKHPEGQGHFFDEPQHFRKAPGVSALERPKPVFVRNGLDVPAWVFVPVVVLVPLLLAWWWWL